MQAERKVIIDEIYKPARRNYPRRKVVVGGIDETWQADLVDMQKYSQLNKGFNFLLTVIDVVSKFAWTIPIKHKSGQDVTAALESIFKTKRIPKKIQADDGIEFYNKNVKNLLKKHKIKLYSTYSGTKASIVERFNRTLKTKMWKQLEIQGNDKWVDILPILTQDYNRSKHRTIGMKPIEVNESNKNIVLQRINEQKYYKIPFRKPKFKVGDVVRISKAKHIFEKGYTANWTTENYTITKVLSTR